MRMDMYKGTVCRVILIGYMEGVPVVHTTFNGKQVLSFFLTRIRPSFEKNSDVIYDQREWYRVYAEKEDAAYIEAYGYSGMRITVYGNAANCVIEKTTASEFVVTEIFAEKLFFFSPDDFHEKIASDEIDEDKKINEQIFLSRIVSSARVAYMH